MDSLRFRKEKEQQENGRDAQVKVKVNGNVSNEARQGRVASRAGHFVGTTCELAERENPLKSHSISIHALTYRRIKECRALLEYK